MKTFRLFAIDPISLAIIAATLAGISGLVGYFLGYTDETEKHKQFKSACQKLAKKTAAHGLEPYRGGTCLNVHASDRVRGSVVPIRIEAGRVKQVRSRASSIEEAVLFSRATGSLSEVHRSEFKSMYESRYLSRITSQWSIEVEAAQGNHDFQIVWSDVVLTADLFDVDGNVEKIKFIVDSSPNLFVVRGGTKAEVAKAKIEQVSD